MKDDAVERVLRGLGAIEAPDGLEGRILRRLAEPDERRAMGWVPEIRLAGGLALTRALVGILGHLHGGHTPGAKAPPPRAAARPKAEALGYLQAEATLGSLESFPAPPAPLTEQERLLVRIARHPQRSEAQFLIAEVRESELAKGHAEFDLFFPPPKTDESTEVSQPVQTKENHNEVQPQVR